MAFPENPHISVCLPVKNGMPFLKDAVEGLMAQSYRNFTLIVQDGVSTDGSLEYLRSFDAFFPIDIVSEQDKSLTQGYARATRRAQGDLLCYMACDEIFDNDAFATYVKWYQQHPDAVYIYGGSRIITDDAEKGKKEEEFQPPVFNLFDYVRQKMCPTTAGAYNRRMLGDALALDESLGSCPDFELLTRLALQFGQEKIIGKNAITMSARGDRSSMSFRAEAHAQFVKDKAIIMERLLTGPLAPAFMKYVERHLFYNLHIASANAIAEMEGCGPLYAQHVLAAEACMPHTDLVGRLAHQSRLLQWDEDAGGIAEFEYPLPECPDETRVMATAPLPLSSLTITPRWADCGARMAMKDGVVEIVTTFQPGFSAALSIDVSSLDFERDGHWLCVDVQPLEGIPQLLLTGSSSRHADRQQELRIMQQKKLYPAQVCERHYFPVKPCRTAALVIANHYHADPSKIALKAVQLVIVPRSGSSHGVKQKCAG